MEKMITVENMSCNHCKKAVESAVLALEGVVSAHVDLAKKTLALTYDERLVTDDMLKEAIEEEGFFIR